MYLNQLTYIKTKYNTQKKVKYYTKTHTKQSGIKFMMTQHSVITQQANTKGTLQRQEHNIKIL